MSSIIIALSKSEDSKRIRDILQRYGLEPTVICTTGSSVVSRLHQLESGVLICGSRLSDMHYTQLLEYMPEYFEMVLIGSAATLESREVMDINTLRIPFKTGELVHLVESLLIELERKLKKKRRMPKKRSEEEQACIDKAKALLMEQKHMTEQEAFRYIQKCSMDSGTGMVEMAQMVLMMN